MNKKQFFLRSNAVLEHLISYLRTLPLSESNPFVVKIGEVGRTLEQNALLWPLLECFAAQLQWPVNGSMVYLDADDWKDLLTAAYRNETQRVAMGLGGGMVILGMRTSKMSKKEFSEFIEFMKFIASERGVDLGDDRIAA